MSESINGRRSFVLNNMWRMTLLRSPKPTASIARCFRLERGGSKRKAELFKAQILSKCAETQQFKSLVAQREKLEDSIVRFKLQLANVKSEIEGYEDLKVQQKATISLKDSQIQSLIQQFETLKSEKHQLVVQQANRSLQHNSKSQSFAKLNLKQYPSSSFQFRLSVDEPDSGVHSTHSIWVSSRHSDLSSSNL